MSDDNPRTRGDADDRADLTADELADRIARERHELGDTVQALATKADVSARARDKVGELRQQATTDPSYGLIAAGVLCVAVGLWLLRRDRR